MPGKTRGPQGAHAAALWNAYIITDHAISRDGDAGGAFAIVQKAVVGLMGGCAAEMVLLDGPPKRTLDGAEIDAVIATVLAAQAAADEHKRWADWRSVEKNAAEFAAATSKCDAVRLVTASG
jgi:hypothetical protein